MASIIQKAVGFATGTNTVSVTLPNPTTPGNRIVAFGVEADHGDADENYLVNLSITDSQGNFRTVQGFNDGNNPQGDTEVVLFPLENAPDTVQFMTNNYSALDALHIGLCVYEVEGLDTSGNADTANGFFRFPPSVPATALSYDNLGEFVSVVGVVFTETEQPLTAGDNSWTLDGADVALIAPSPLLVAPYSSLAFQSKFIDKAVVSLAPTFSGPTGGQDSLASFVGWPLADPPAPITGPFLGSVVVSGDESDPDSPFLGTVHVISSPPDGDPTAYPFLGRVKVGTAPAGASNKIQLGTVVVLDSAPDGDPDSFPFLGTVESV